MYKIYNTILDFSDYLKYDFLSLSDKPVTQTPTSISIQFHQKPESNFVWIDSRDYPGLFASGYSNDPTELWKCLNDAILSYFGVPRYEAKKRGLPYSLPLPNGQAIVQQDAQKYAGA
ncbi:MAG: hypothetical protein UX64_C0012G0004 [Microgenomates group bacterium GW2011_GWC2_46_7]|nr:MAG: hypothetical protein UX64_C0012G0004 [Microgenomates group bacterium GW2011_GWC2_46_7]